MLVHCNEILISENIIDSIQFHQVIQYFMFARIARHDRYAVVSFENELISRKFHWIRVRCCFWSYSHDSPSYLAILSFTVSYFHAKDHLRGRRWSCSLSLGCNSVFIVINELAIASPSMSYEGIAE